MASKSLYDRQTTSPISRSLKYKKVTKPQLERKRRARINRSLDQLKNILHNYDDKKNEIIRDRLEKADILEMTIQHLYDLHYSRTSSANKYEEGFNKCAREAYNYLKWNKSRHEEITACLSKYLQTCQPLHVEVPDYRLIFPSPTSPTFSRERQESNVGGLLMEAPLSNDFMWRPWLKLQSST